MDTNNTSLPDGSYGGAVTSRVCPWLQGEEPPWQKEMFLRDLSEVHMLIDYVSGRPDRSLSCLTGVPGKNSFGTSTDSMPPQLVVEEICKISYPPGGTREANGQQAALIMSVKDRLNALASPARGLTIAFTAMFAGVALQYSKLSPGGKNQKKSFFSAREAYPNLEYQARKFRSFYSRLPAWTLFLIFLITITNWDVSVTSGVLQQIAKADADYNALFSPGAKFLPLPAVCHGPASKAVLTATAKRGSSSAQSDSERTQVSVCMQADAAYKAVASGRANLQELFRGPSSYVRPLAISVRLFGPVNNASACGKGNEACLIDRTPLESFVAAVMNGLSSIVLPTAFGLLGTIAGLVRSITAKVQDSTLAPRHYQVARVAIFLGMAAGLSVGLFFTPTDASATLVKSIGSPITASSAGLSFLAGFGAESFFGFLDNVLKRLFPPETAAKPSKP